MNDLTYTLPNDITEWYIKGTFTDDNGKNIYFEIPAVFNEDDTVNDVESVEKLQNFILQHNIKHLIG